MDHQAGAIAGALFDFLGYLTTQEQPITLSASHEPHRALDLLREWAVTRGLPLEEADVKHWNLGM